MSDTTPAPATTAPATTPATKTAAAVAAKKPARTGRGAKPHVPSACTNCKKAHLACDLQRPCRRCVNMGKCDTCKDVQHKKRGRPRSKDKKIAAAGTEKSLMETQMFQFSFTTTAPPSPTHTAISAPPAVTCAMQPTANLAPSQPASPATASASPVLPAAPPVPRQSQNNAARTTIDNAHAVHSEQSPIDEPTNSSTSYLFLTPSLLCLRLEELATAGVSRALLGHSLLSLINRSIIDFISPHDVPQVQGAFASMKQRLMSRLGQPTRTYTPMLGHSRSVDPNTFQALPVDRLLQRVCGDVSANVRAHLRTATGCYDLFDIHVFVGAVGSPAQLSLDDVYFVCRISKFDALSCAPSLSSSLLPRIAMPTGFSPVDSISEIVDRPTKRQRIASPASDALYMLAAVTDSDASSNGNSPRSTPVHSTSASSPVLASPSPMARSPRMTSSLPPLSDLLKSMDQQFLPRPSF